MNKLIILESPGKIKKVTQFLNEIDKNNNYIVKASIGHVRELDDSEEYKIGLNIKTMIPNFIVSNDKRKVVNELKQLSKEVDEIILATDPDREGEVIAWHLYDLLKPFNQNFKRLRLNAITSECIKKEMQNLSEINIDYVNAGLARSYLDKITGYILSRVLQDQNIGKSAGRVQSAVLRILADIEDEIKNFKKEEWFILRDNLSVVFKNVEMLEENKFEVIKYKTFDEVMNVKKGLNNFYYVDKITTIDFKDKPFVNFTTSDYLQAAKSNLKLKVKDSTKIAQSLFDKGLITYIRTDSTKLDQETENKLIEFVITKFGQNAIGKIHTKNEKETDQEGHPPITPTHFEWLPGNIQNYCDENLTIDEINVYTLIWKNTINSALKQPKGNKNTYILKNNNQYFLGEVKEYIDLGYYNFDKDLSIPKSQNLNWSIGQKINCFSIQVIMQNSNPKPRFGEATLIKELERLAIGRPSTYKTSVEVNQKRLYVETDQKDIMYVTDQGIKVDNFLKQNFKEFINLDFTKNMEKDLDLIAKAQIDYKTYVKNYYEKIEKEGKKYMIDIAICPKCKKGFLKQKDYEGAPLQCSEYKTCDFIQASKNAQNCGNDNCIGKIYTIEYLKDNQKKSFLKCTQKECFWIPTAIQQCPFCQKGWLIIREYQDKKTKASKNLLVCNAGEKICGKVIDFDYKKKEEN